MKKFKLLALAFVLGTVSLFATNGVTPDEPNKEIRNQMVQLLDTPDFTVQEDMDIAITFTFNSEGEIVVLNVNSQNTEVLNYVRENLNGKVMKIPGERDKLYAMPLKIKAI